jgi:hypothetical protein
MWNECDGDELTDSVRKTSPSEIFRKIVIEKARKMREKHQKENISGKIFALY